MDLVTSELFRLLHGQLLQSNVRSTLNSGQFQHGDMFHRELWTENLQKGRLYIGPMAGKDSDCAKFCSGEVIAPAIISRIT